MTLEGLKGFNFLPKLNQTCLQVFSDFENVLYLKGAGAAYQNRAAHIQAPNILRLVNFRYISCCLLSFLHRVAQ